MSHLLPYFLFAFAIIFSVFLSLKKFLRELIKQLFWILVEKVTGGFFVRLAGFPRVGLDTLTDVSSPTWVTNALNHKFPKTVVNAVEAKSIGSDMGNASTMFLLNVDYSKNPFDLPDRMVIKLAKADLKNRLPFTATRMNEMETKFYSTSLSDEFIAKGLNFARGYAGKYRKEGGNCFVIMEDVTQAPQFAKFTTEQEPIQDFDEAVAIVKQIAKFHSVLFNAKKRFKTDLKWIIHQNDPILGMTKEFFLQGWPVFIKRLGDRIPEEVKSRGFLLATVAQQLHDFMGLAPNTLVHGDCHLENSYFVNETGELGFYDMQLMRIGKGALDLASFIGGSFSTELLIGGVSRDQGEHQLLQEYLTALEENVGKKLEYVNEYGHKVIYDLSALKRDYKMGLAMLLVWNVSAALAVPFDTCAHVDYDEYAVRLVNSVHRTSAINYALWFLSVPGVCERLNLRGGSPKLDPWLNTPPIQRVIPGRATNVEHNVRLHHAKISPEDGGSGFLDKYVYRPLKYKLIHQKTSSRKGHHGQNITDVSDEDLEGHHSVTFAEGTPMQNFAMDSYYVSAFEQNGPSFALRWCRRYHESEGELWLAIKMPGADDLLLWPDHPTTRCICQYEGSNTVIVKNKDGTSKMSLTCVIPMKKWKIKYIGQLMIQSTKELVNCRFELETESCMPHFAFASHTSPALTAQSLANERFSRELFDELKATHQEHYEQFSFVNGYFDFDGNRHQIQAKGMRDRAFGAREWGYMNRYIASYLWCGDMNDGMVLSLACASLPTMTAGKFGFVGFKPDELPHPIDAMSGTIAEIAPDGTPPLEWELAFRCHGTHFLIRGFADPNLSTGLNMGPNGMWVHLRFARFDVSYVNPKTFELVELEGIGASEFGYRFEGYQPYRPTTAGASPVFAKS